MRSVVLVPVLGVLLAGCTGGSVAAKPSTLAPVTASPSPSPVALEVPEGAKAATPQGAAAFVRFYYEQLGEAMASLDSGAIKRLSSPTCQECSAIAAALDAERAAGHRYRGGAVTIRSAEAVADSATKTSVTLVYDVAELAPVGGGKVLPAAMGVRLEVQVERRGESWLVDKITDLQS